ncbi:unnamed protein product [Pleuronectes platessa]|uniref:Uncharacterized protein n=1 Tax=Pleuronectes platessa TaxID=8262 RepID=A0A9N7UIN5_PLEPL|nr:unnamed protein product [Pleuronectes platessa]
MLPESHLLSHPSPPTPPLSTSLPPSPFTSPSPHLVYDTPLYDITFPHLPDPRCWQHRSSWILERGRGHETVITDSILHLKKDPAVLLSGAHYSRDEEDADMPAQSAGPGDQLSGTAEPKRPIAGLRERGWCAVVEVVVGAALSSRMDGKETERAEGQRKREQRRGTESATKGGGRKRCTPPGSEARGEAGGSDRERHSKD